MGNRNNKNKDVKGTDPEKPTKKDPEITKPSAENRTIDLKFFIIGDFGVGKTSLALKFAKDKFDEELSKSNNQVPHADIDPMQGGKKIGFFVNDSIQANIIHFDTNGNEKFRSATITPFAEANIIFICFAINNLESFNQLSYWYREAVQYTKEKKPLVVLVGTKQDLIWERRVPREEAEKFGARQAPSILYYEVSAKTGYNVKELYTLACNELLRKVESGAIPNPFEENDG